MRDIHVKPVSYYPSENLEYPMMTEPQLITPNELFYVRNHFEYPFLDVHQWSLSIEGMVVQPLQLTYQDLLKMNLVTLPATLECAGNKRSLWDKKAQGVQFGLGAISHAEWRGVRLKDVLEQAGISNQAKEVVFQGLDSGQRPDMEEQVFFERSLPLEKALHPDTLLALEMNGQPLPFKHGFPLRLLVPGYYAMASVKWLHRIRVVQEAFKGPFQNIDYVILEKPNDYRHATPVSSVVINSSIASPTEEEEIAIGQHVICGYAWAGEHSVSKVEVSTDGGKHWREAQLLDPDRAYSWRRWSLDWRVDQPGVYTLMAKATNELGESQPIKAKWNSKGYQNHAVHVVHVHVADAKLTENLLHEKA